jgi:sodium transport system ATP-binding protein
MKTALARALVHDPANIVLDEPTNGLDVVATRALREALRVLRDETGKCIVFSTHIMREAEKLCDQIAILHRGYILAEGSLEEVRDQHHQRDLEELFFQLISQHDEPAASAGVPSAFLKVGETPSLRQPLTPSP